MLLYFNITNLYINISILQFKKTEKYLNFSYFLETMSKPTIDRIASTIKGTYQPVIDKILKHRPHLKNKAGVIERALDFYLDDIVRVDNEKKR